MVPNPPLVNSTLTLTSNLQHHQSEDAEASLALGSGEGTVSSLRARKATTISRLLPKPLTDSVDPTRSYIPLSIYCFMSGWINVLCFSATFVWCGFQTGNTMQLSLAIARLWDESRDKSFQIPDQHALISLIAFSIGVLLGARIGERIGSNTRLWLACGTFAQALVTMAAAIILKASGAPSVADYRANTAWTDPLTHVVVGLISFSMGLQGIMAKRVNSHFAAAVVLTTTWVDFMGDPGLFYLRRLPSRDHRFAMIVMFILGGITSRAALEYIGSPAALGVACGLRTITSLTWLYVPARETQDEEKLVEKLVENSVHCV